MGSCRWIIDGNICHHCLFLMERSFPSPSPPPPPPPGNTVIALESNPLIPSDRHSNFTRYLWLLLGRVISWTEEGFPHLNLHSTINREDTL